MNILLTWLVFMLLFLVIGYILDARSRTTEAAAASNGLTNDGVLLPALRERLAPVLAVAGEQAHRSGFLFEGKLRTNPQDALTQLRREFQSDHFTPLLEEGDQPGRVKVALLRGIEQLAPRTAEPEPPKWGVHLLLFALTLGTTTWAGALHAGVDLLREPNRFAIGLPYSLGLMLILGAHELGHYFAAKHHGIHVTPPYFIPVPFALGTFGAFIKLKSLSPDRRASFDVAIAGPLAGLVFAIPALLIGLKYSRVVLEASPNDMLHTGVQVGSSFLLAVLTRIALGTETITGHQLMLHPLAFAGWLGLFVTALNLLPIGQLDGGHIASAVFGSRRGHFISVGALVTLFALALFVWPGLMMWAVIVWFIAGTRDVPPLNDITPVNAARRTLGWLAFLLLAAIIIPVPHALYPSFGIHCPYL